MTFFPLSVTLFIVAVVVVVISVWEFSSFVVGLVDVIAIVGF